MGGTQIAKKQSSKSGNSGNGKAGAAAKASTKIPAPVKAAAKPGVEKKGAAKSTTRSSKSLGTKPSDQSVTLMAQVVVKTK